MNKQKSKHNFLCHCFIDSICFKVHCTKKHKMCNQKLMDLGKKINEIQVKEVQTVTSEKFEFFIEEKKVEQLTMLKKLRKLFTKIIPEKGI